MTPLKLKKLSISPLELLIWCNAPASRWGLVLCQTAKGVKWPLYPWNFYKISNYFYFYFFIKKKKKKRPTQRGSPVIVNIILSICVSYILLTTCFQLSTNSSRLINWQLDLWQLLLWHVWRIIQGRVRSWRYHLVVHWLL
jgi:hypothetical protein